MNTNPRTFIHADHCVSINGFAISWEDFDKLEPAYHWDDRYPTRIYRVDGLVPSSIDPTVLLTQGGHVLVDTEGKRHDQPVPWAEGDTYCERLPEYKKKLAEMQTQQKQLDFAKIKTDYKELVRKQCVNATTPAQKADVEKILQQMDDAWGTIKMIVLGRKLEPYYDNSHLMAIINANQTP